VSLSRQSPATSTLPGEAAGDFAVSRQTEICTKIETSEDWIVFVASFLKTVVVYIKWFLMVVKVRIGGMASGQEDWAEVVHSLLEGVDEDLERDLGRNGTTREQALDLVQTRIDQVLDVFQGSEPLYCFW
jgi:hypothetical protein